MATGDDHESEPLSEDALHGGAPRALPAFTVTIGAVLLGYATFVAPNLSMANMSFCVALAVILGALGTQARVEHRWWTITGSGAIALILAAVLKQGQAPVTFGVIEGGFGPSSQVIVKDDHELLGALDPKAGEYRFAVEGLLHRSVLSVFILTASGNANAEDRLSVRAEALRPYFRSNRLIEWEYDSQRHVLVDRSSKVVVSEPVDPRPAARTASLGVPFTVGVAFAATVSSECARQSLEERVTELRSENLRVRLAAQEILGNCGTEAIDALLPALQSQSTKAQRSGAAYALLQIVRRSSDLASYARGQLIPDRSNVLVEMLGDANDDDLRDMGTATLIEIGDERFAKPVAQLIQDTKDPEVRYDALMVLEAIATRATPEEQGRIVAEVKKLTTDLDQNTQVLVRDFGKPRYFVVVASFKDQERATAAVPELQKTAAATVGVYLMNTKYFAVAMGPTTLAEAVRSRQAAVEQGRASQDAWITSKRRFVREIT